MKSKEKYYTPSIEEFHVGFEYEQAGLDCHWVIREWNKKIISLVTNIEDIKDFSHHNRVKYLDREDIESLGFELKRSTGDYQFHYEKDLNSHILINLTHLPSSNLIRISKEDGNIFENLLYHSFQGTIKNKSELKILLKQLSITLPLRKD